MKKSIILLTVIMACLWQAAGYVNAMETTFLGKPLSLFGYITQGGSYTFKDEIDTEEDFSSAIWAVLLEGEYRQSDELKFFGQFFLTGDWIYDFKHSDDSWSKKEFSDSRDELGFDDKYWQIIKELNLTWTPGNFLFRFGKQIVSWGQTDGIRLMDQINPQDLRRGLSDVEFETTIIPVWLARVDYYPEIYTGWLNNFNLQFWFNPNADFIPTQGIAAGNDKGGIWAPYLEVFPGVHLGSRHLTLDEPDTWNDDGHEFGFRVQGDIYDSIVSLNYFYGLDNDPITLTNSAPTFSVSPDGVNLVHLNQRGYYPRMKFFGGTFTRDLQSLRKLMLGISPVLRLEAFYAMDSTFVRTNPVTFGETIEYHDELRWAIGLDWKIRVPLINKAQGISLSGQYFNRHIPDLDGNETLTSTTGTVEENNQSFTLSASTGYLNGKLTPSIFYQKDITNHAYLLNLSLKYKPTYDWEYTIGGMFIGGDNPGKGLEVFDHKDYLYFSISYRWG